MEANSSLSLSTAEYVQDFALDSSGPSREARLVSLQSSPDGWILGINFAVLVSIQPYSNRWQEEPAHASKLSIVNFLAWFKVKVIHKIEKAPSWG